MSDYSYYIYLELIECCYYNNSLLTSIDDNVELTVLYDSNIYNVLNTIDNRLTSCCYYEYTSNILINQLNVNLTTQLNNVNKNLQNISCLLTSINTSLMTCCKNQGNNGRVCSSCNNFR